MCTCVDSPTVRSLQALPYLFTLVNFQTLPYLSTLIYKYLGCLAVTNLPYLFTLVSRPFYICLYLRTNILGLLGLLEDSSKASSELWAFDLDYGLCWPCFLRPYMYQSGLTNRLVVELSASLVSGQSFYFMQPLNSQSFPKDHPLSTILGHHKTTLGGSNTDGSTQ